MEEFVQEFKKTVRGSSFEERVLVEEFKQEMNETIRGSLWRQSNPLGPSNSDMKELQTLTDIEEKVERRKKDCKKEEKQELCLQGQIQTLMGHKNNACSSPKFGQAVGVRVTSISPQSLQSLLQETQVHIDNYAEDKTYLQKI